MPSIKHLPFTIVQVLLDVLDEDILQRRTYPNGFLRAVNDAHEEQKELVMHPDTNTKQQTHW